MTAYMIIDITIIDEVLYTAYIDRVYDVVVHYGGRYLVRGGNITPLGGTWNPQRLVIIAFPTREAIRKCFSSEAYSALAPLRENSTVSHAVVADEYIACKETI